MWLNNFQKACTCVLLFATVLSKELIAGNKRVDSDSTKAFLGIILKTDIIMPVIAFAGPELGLSSSAIAFSVTAEKLLQKRASVQFTYLQHDYTDKSGLLISRSLVDKWHTFQLIPEFKLFVSKKRLHTGYYVGVYVKYTQMSWSDDEVDYLGNNSYYTKTTQELSRNVAGGIINGYQFYAKKRITLDALLGIGVGELVYSKIISGTVVENYSPKLDTRFAFNIGYKF